MSKEQPDHPTETRRPLDATDAAESSKYGEKAKCGVATDLWLELLVYPDAKKIEGLPAKIERRLYLRVAEKWRWWYGDDPFVFQSVQSAFCNCIDSLEVVVWYYDDDRIVGLVVRSKYSLTERDQGA